MLTILICIAGDEAPAELATGVGGGDDDRTTANCGSAAAPDELLTSSTSLSPSGLSLLALQVAMNIPSKCTAHARRFALAK